MSILKSMRTALTPAQIRETLTHVLNRFRTPQLTYLPGGWESVEGRTQGWQDANVSDAEAAKWKRYCELVNDKGPLGFSHESDDITSRSEVSFHNIHITFGYVLALAARKKERVRVLDWGGSLGHYHVLGKSLVPDIEIEYHVKEMPALAAAGRKINPDVIWHDDDRCLDEKYDLVFVNSSLQYDRRWQDTLRGLVRATGDYLFLTRLCVVQNVPTFLALQKAYDTEMFHLQFNERELLDECLRENEVELMRHIIVGHRPWVKDAPEQCEAKGWLFRRRVLK